MMLADAEEVDSELVREHAFLDHIADDLCVRFRSPVLGLGHIAERIEPEFDSICHHDVSVAYRNCVVGIYPRSHPRTIRKVSAVSFEEFDIVVMAAGVALQMPGPLRLAEPP